MCVSKGTQQVNVKLSNKNEFSQQFSFWAIICYMHAGWNMWRINYTRKKKASKRRYIYIFLYTTKLLNQFGKRVFMQIHSSLLCRTRKKKKKLVCVDNKIKLTLSVTRWCQSVTNKKKVVFILNVLAERIPIFEFEFLLQICKWL